MRAAVLESFGAALQIRDLPDPSPTSGQVLVRIVASGLNPLDTKIRRGRAAHAGTVLPAVLGLDLAGGSHLLLEADLADLNKTQLANMEKTVRAAMRGQSGPDDDIAIGDFKASGSTILPGAICDNFTSFGGQMGSGSGQTLLSEFLRYGAAGASMGAAVGALLLMCLGPEDIRVYRKKGG